MGARRLETQAKATDFVSRGGSILLHVLHIHDRVALATGVLVGQERSRLLNSFVMP